MLLDVESNEDLDLIKNALNELLSREWRGVKKHEVSNEEIMNLFNKMKDLGIFQFIRETSLTNALIINELIGFNLLPGIISTTAMIGFDYPVSVGVNYVIEADKAKAIITPKGIANNAKLVEVSSPDPSVKVYKILDADWSSSNVDFNKILLMASAQIIGHGMACMKETIEYSKNRTTFGKPIGSYQAIKHKIVDDVIGLELVRSRYLYNPSNYLSIFNHAYKKALKAILDSIQIHGGIGFTTDLDLHLHLKRVILLQKIMS
ncbi:MAG: acyl-CoA dehydrogenase family protein [Sulfolobaceae archaeon]|jgi:hypothetical protein